MLMVGWMERKEREPRRGDQTRLHHGREDVSPPSLGMLKLLFLLVFHVLWQTRAACERLHSGI